MPRVSVVIPTYDASGHAARAVESVLAQTFGDLEAVVVDDGSCPEEAARLDRLAAQDRVVLARQENQGPARARRRGWETARGELVSFLDSDDRYLPSYVERCVAFFDARPELGGVYTRYVWVDPATLEHGRVQPEEGPEGWIFVNEVQKSRVKTSTLMVRREHLLGLRGLAEHLRRGESYDMVLRLCYRTPFGFVPETLVEVFRTAGSLSRPGTERRDWLNRVEILERILQSFDDMDEESARAVRKKLGRYCCKSAAGIARTEDWDRALGLYRKAISYDAGARTVRKYCAARLRALFLG